MLFANALVLHEVAQAVPEYLLDEVTAVSLEPACSDFGVPGQTSSARFRFIDGS